MANYTKLFSSILQSTVWHMKDSYRLLWISMLALADQDGIVEAAVPGLAHTARISLEDCEAGLATFMEPDPYSRTPDNEGRRIEKINGGWRLLNFELYRDRKSQEETRRKAAERQQRRRDRMAQVTPSNAVTRDITPSSPSGSGSGSGSGSDQALSRAIQPASPPEPPAPPVVPAPWHEAIPPRGHTATLGAKTPAFLRMFARYPNKMAEHVAAAHFQHFAGRHPKGEEGLADEILAALPRLARSAPYDCGPRFWPSFERFLDERRWVDQPTESRGPPQRAGDLGPTQQPDYPKLA